MKTQIKKISVIQVDDEYLADLFGTCDGDEIFLEDDMNDYIQDEIDDDSIDEDDIESIRELQAIIREELKTSPKVKVEYVKEVDNTPIKTTIYRVSDDEWEEVMGRKQVCQFAVSQVQNSQDDYLEENLKEVFEDYKGILELADRVIKGETNITLEQAETLLHVRCYEVEEFDVY